MKSLIRILALAVVALAVSPVAARASANDPPPILTEQLAVVLDLAEDCPGGVCLVNRSRAAPAPAVVSASTPTACEAPATVRRFRPLANTIHRVRTWYPGKAIQSVRTAFGGR